MKARRLEKIKSTTMIPLVDGTYREESIECHAYECPCCGLVWNRKHLAEDCEKRGHVTAFEQMYGFRRIVNGMPEGNIYAITRKALRREPIQDENIGHVNDGADKLL